MGEAITVLMPARNAAATVKTAVRSTLRDLRDSDRMLVFDDASTDQTADLVQAIAASDHRLTLVHSSIQRGVAGGLNHLLAEAKSSLVARMDADDVVLPGRFRRQMRALSAGARVCFTSRLNFGPRMASFRPYIPRYISPRVMPWLLLKTNPVAHSTMLSTRQAIEDVGGYRQSAAEDWDLWLRLAAINTNFVSLAIPGIAYRIHPDQITRSSGWEEQLSSDALLQGSFNELARHLGWTGGDNVRAVGPNMSEFEDFIRNGLLSNTRLLERAAAGVVR